MKVSRNGTRIAFAAALGCVLCASTGLANAGVPGWARRSRVLGVDVAGCVDQADRVMRYLTGNSSVRSRVDASYTEIRGFNTDTAVFVTCSAVAEDKVCGKPLGRLTILAFSGLGSGEASRGLEAVDRAVGEPRTIDCGPRLNPVN